MCLPLLNFLKPDEHRKAVHRSVRELDDATFGCDVSVPGPQEGLS